MSRGLVQCGKVNRGHHAWRRSRSHGKIRPNNHRENYLNPKGAKKSTLTATMPEKSCLSASVVNINVVHFQFLKVNSKLLSPGKFCARLPVGRWGPTSSTWAFPKLQGEKPFTNARVFSGTFVLGAIVLDD